MSTNYHTPIVVGSDVESDGPGGGAINPRLSDLDTAIGNITGILDANGNIVTDGTYNNGALILGAGHLWVNAGQLYFKNGAPASATDGTILA